MQHSDSVTDSFNISEFIHQSTNIQLAARATSTARLTLQWLQIRHSMMGLMASIAKRRSQNWLQHALYLLQLAVQSQLQHNTLPQDGQLFVYLSRHPHLHSQYAP